MRASGCLGTHARFFASEGEARRRVLRARLLYTRDERLREYANESFVFARGDAIRCAHACEAKSWVKTRSAQVGTSTSFACMKFTRGSWTW